MTDRAPKDVPPNMRLVSQEALDNAIEMLACPMVYQKCVDRRARGEKVCCWCQAREGLQAWMHSQRTRHE